MKRIIILIVAVFFLLSMLPNATEASYTSATSSKIVSDSKALIGTPYKWGGTTTSGFDCSGYMVYVFKKSGLSLPRTTTEQMKLGIAVSKSNLKAGDLVFFNTSGKGVSHAGIYIGNNNFIHASSSKGVMISSINDPYYWGSKYIGAKRVYDFSDHNVIQAAAKKPPVSIYNVSRIEVAETLVRALGLTAKSNGTYYTDIYSTNPKIKYINAAYEAGIFTGSNGKFNPNDKLTRSQMAKILTEAYKLSGKKDPKFKDVPNKHWAKDYIHTLYYNNITTGYTNGYYGVNDKVTNTQFAKFMDRAK